MVLMNAIKLAKLNKLVNPIFEFALNKILAIK
jgi:hypothetical protein